MSWLKLMFVAGVVLRTDLATHGLRLDAGIARGRTSATVIVDPIGRATGSQQDTDVMIERAIGGGAWALTAGWRHESVPLVRLRYGEEDLVLGAIGTVPRRALGAVRVRFGAELTVAAVRHGAGLPTRWMWDHPLGDAIDVGFSARFELAGTP